MLSDHDLSAECSSECMNSLLECYDDCDENNDTVCISECLRAEVECEVRDWLN